MVISSRSSGGSLVVVSRLVKQERYFRIGGLTIPGSAVTASPI